MKRGTRGLPIVRGNDDRKRFARLLYILNDVHQDEFWEKKTLNLPMFERPAEWPERDPLTRILAWTLKDNHFHLMFEEIRDGGIAKFMQRLGGSMSVHANAKYKEKGSLFQGGYKGRTVDTDEYLRQLIPYIMVKNVFEMYPGGYEKALKEFDLAWKWGVESYPFSSLPEYAGTRDWPIIEKGIIGDLFSNPEEFKRHCREVLLSRQNMSKEFKKLTLE